MNFYWFEEPMDESSMSSYKWLSDQLDIPVIGPETMTGKISTRAEWIKNDVVDILRGGVGDLGGLTPLMKVAHLAESFNMAMEVHGVALVPARRSVPLKVARPHRRDPT